jgi:hypothetical protein
LKENVLLFHKLETFYNRFKRSVLNISSPEVISNQELLNRPGQHEIGSGNQREIELVGHMRKQVKGPVERKPLDWNA